MGEAPQCWIDRWGITICVSLAALLRIAVICSSLDQLTQDRDAYLGIARSVAEGRGYSQPDTSIPTAFRPPVFPLQVAYLMIVVPASAAVAIVNVCWGLVAVWATGKTAQQLGLGRLGLLSSLLVALDPMLVQYSTQPMTESTCVGLAVLMLYWIVRQDAHAALRQLVIGMLFGLLVLCRPTFWPFVAVMAIWSVFSRAVSSAQPRAATLFNRGALRMAIGTMLIISPWIVRNQIVMGAPILMTTHGGYTLLLANNPVFYSDVVDRGWGTEWDNSSFNPWQSALQADLIRELGPNATEMQRDRWQSLQARDFIREHPDRFLRAAWHRFRSLWSPVPQSEAAASVNPWLLSAIGGYYGVFLLAFVVGMVWIIVRGDARRWRPLYAMILTVQLVHLLYWTNARMRAPLVPAMSLFAVAPLSRRLQSSSSLPTTESP